MKKAIYLLCTLFVLTSLPAFSQNVGIGTKQPNPSAALDITDSTRGLLMPRLTSQQKRAIKNPATGLVIYQVGDSSGLWYFDKQWNYIGSSPLPSALSTSSVAVFDDISDFASFTGGEDLIFVKELMRGGFFYRYAGSRDVDNGMIFIDGRDSKWIRYLEGNKINVQWYGAMPGSTPTASTNYDAVMAAFNYIIGSADHKTLFIPGDRTDKYFFDQTITLNRSISIEGEGSPTSQGAGLITRLSFPANTTCFVLEPEDAIGNLATYDISRLWVTQEEITSGFNLDAHAFDIHSVVKMEDVYVRFSAGNGINILGGHPFNESNADKSVFNNVSVNACQNGFFIDGGDANIISFTSISASNCRGWGVWDRGFLGNNYTAPHFTNNGAGTAVGEGGPVFIDNDAAWTTITSPYTEDGQNPIILNSRSLVINGDNGAGVGGGSFIHLFDHRMYISNSHLVVPGNDQLFSLGTDISAGQPKVDISHEVNALTGIRMRNPNNGNLADIQNRVINDADQVGYFGITSSGYNASFNAEINHGAVYMGSEGSNLAIITQTDNDIFFAPHQVTSTRINSGGQLRHLTDGALSRAAIWASGAWLVSGGTGTTTKPHLLIEPSGTTSTSWNTNGTGLGVNAASGFSGNLVDMQVAGSPRFSVNASGDVFLNRALRPGDDAGSTGKILESRGDLLAPIWVTKPSGTVTFVGLSMPSIFTVTNSPVTTSNTITVTPNVTQGDLIYATATNTLSLLPKNTSATRYLSNTGTGNNPAWAQVDLTNGVTGTAPVTNGGTGSSSLTPYALLTGGTSSSSAMQQVVAASGTEGKVLQSNGPSALPSWVTVSGGSGTVTSVGLSAGTAGTDVNITTSTVNPITASGIFTVNVPDANAGYATGSSETRGVVNTTTQSFKGSKIFYSTAAASLSGVSAVGGWFSGGSATTTKPQLLVEPLATTSTGWSTAGTGLGVNSASGFTGNLADLQKNGASKFAVNHSGDVTFTGFLLPNGTNGTSGQVLTLNSSLLPTWQTATGGSSGWALLGNTGTSSSNFLGTIDNTPLRIRTYNTEKMIIDADGLVGIGTSSPSSYLNISPPGILSDGTSLFKISTQNTYGTMDMLDYAANGGFTMKNRNGDLLSAYLVTSELYDFYKTVRVLSNFRVSGASTTQTIGGYNWDNTIITLNAPTITYRATRDEGYDYTAHAFTILNAMTGTNSNLATFDNAGSSKFTIRKDGSTSIGTSSPNASAALDVSSTTKGFLPPRMLGSEAEAISSKAEGLMVYATDGSGSTITSKGWWGWTGSTWVKLN